MYHYAGNNPVKYTDPDGREDDDYHSLQMPVEENTVNVRVVYETTENYIKINETVSNTDIEFSVNIGKRDGFRSNGIEQTKIDISMFVENSVSNESRENSGLFSKYALASELKACIKIGNESFIKNQSVNADEGNSFSIYIPKTDTPSISIDLFVIAINQNQITETFNYEVNFK